MLGGRVGRAVLDAAAAVQVAPGRDAVQDVGQVAELGLVILGVRKAGYLAIAASASASSEYTEHIKMCT